MLHMTKLTRSPPPFSPLHLPTMYDPSYVKELKALSNYAAAPQFPSLVEWKVAGNGHTLMWKNTFDPVIAVAVLQILDYKLKCSPSGNFIKSEVAPLDRAKFQLFAARPADPNFGDDYQKLYPNLAKLQCDIATSKDHRDMLHKDITGRMMRFVRSVFEKRVRDKRISRFHLSLTSPTKNLKGDPRFRLPTPHILRRRYKTRHSHLRDRDHR